MKEITLNLTEDTELNFGQKIYFIETKDPAVSFKASCPFCNDSRKIIYKGKEFDCPECSANNVFMKIEKLYLREYFIATYTINRVVIEGPEVIAYYNTKDILKGQISFQAFYKTTLKNSFSGPPLKIRSINPHFLQNNVDFLKDPKFTDNKLYFFKDKNLAKKALKIFIEKDKEILSKFNARYHTNYEYPFK